MVPPRPAAPRRRSWLKVPPHLRLCAIFVLGAAGCPEAPSGVLCEEPPVDAPSETPGPAPASPLRIAAELDLTLDFEEGPGRYRGRVVQLDGRLRIEENLTGFLSVDASDGATMQRVTATFDARGVRINVEDDPTISFRSRFYFDFSELELEDGDGDGALDSGEGRGRCYYSWLDYDILVTEPCSFQAVARPDERPTTLRVSSRESWGGRVLPNDRLDLMFDAPVRRAELDKLQIYAGGTPIAGSFERSRDPLMAVRFAPIEPLPFGAPITVKTGGAVDPLERPIVWDRRSLDVPKAPRPITENLGLESSEAWIHLGSQIGGRWHQTAPMDGQYQLVLVGDERSAVRAAGWFDVGEASSLSFFAASLGIFHESARVMVFDGAREVFRHELESRSDGMFCAECCPPSRVLSYAPVNVDLVPHQGRTLTIVAEVWDPHNPWMTTTLLLDAFHIE